MVRVDLKKTNGEMDIHHSSRSKRIFKVFFSSDYGVFLSSFFHKHEYSLFFDDL